MVTRYDVIGSRWSSHFWVKLFFTSFSWKKHTLYTKSSTLFNYVIFCMTSIKNILFLPFLIILFFPLSNASRSAATHNMYLIFRAHRSAKGKNSPKYWNTAKTQGINYLSRFHMLGSINPPWPQRGYDFTCHPRVNWSAQFWRRLVQVYHEDKVFYASQTLPISFFLTFCFL